MNENSSNTPSTSASHHGLTAEAISRRAYELWEQEGRPENRDLHHWLRAEQELLAEQTKSAAPASASSAAKTAGSADLPMSASAARPAAGGRPAGKRNSGTPFPAESAGGRFSPPAGRNETRRGGR